MLKSSGIFPISLVYQTGFFARNLQSTPPVNSFPLSSPYLNKKNGRRTQLRTPSVFEKRGFMFDFVSFALSRSDIHKNHRAYRKGRQVVVCVIAALRFQEVGGPTAGAIGDGGLLFRRDSLWTRVVPSPLLSLYDSCECSMQIHAGTGRLNIGCVERKRSLAQSPNAIRVGREVSRLERIRMLSRHIWIH